MSNFNFSIDLPIRSEWSNVDLLRTSVQNCFTAVFSDIDGCQALAMVTGELLENAIKYGDWTSQGEFRLRVWGQGRHAHVSVENPIKKDDPGVADVLATLTWLKGFTTAQEAYRAKLLEIAASPDKVDISRLGLVRIAYEGNCVLSAEVISDGKRHCLKVTAETTV